MKRLRGLETRLTSVAAAVIERGGRVLICRRRADQDHPGKWEFPGGKLEPGETAGEALRRELREELGIEARVGDEIARYEYEYPGSKPLQLIFFSVNEFDGEMLTCEFDEIRWVERGELPGFDFLDGDAEFIRQLSAGVKQPGSA